MSIEKGYLHLKISKRKIYAGLLILSFLLTAVVGVEVGRALTGLPTYTLNAPPASACDAYIGEYSNGTYYWESGDWQTWANSASVETIFTDAVHSGTAVFIQNGTYNLATGLSFALMSNVTLDFSKGATLNVPNSMNAPAIFLNGCNNWVITGVTINGNAANQVISGPELQNPDGILTVGCSNFRVDNAYIYDCRVFGVEIITQTGSAPSVHSGVTNSKFLFCGWNGINLGIGGSGNIGQNDLYAINNEVAYTGDVGITSFGNSSIIQDNYVHDINGTMGAGNNHIGIGVEGGGNNRITGNTISNCLNDGIMIAAWNGGTGSMNTISQNTISNCINYGITVKRGNNSNTISLNNIAYCNQGINIDSEYNIISNNQIIDWDSTHSYLQAIIIRGNNNQIIGNTCNITYPFSDSFGIDVNSGNDNQIISNSIISPGSYGDWGIVVGSGCLRTTVDQNKIIGFAVNAGIHVIAGAVNTVVRNNDLALCTGTKIIDSGTTTSIYTNTGYNPVGYIARPISGSTAYIVDSGSISTWDSGKVYTNTESPKVLNISAGIVSIVAQNGVTLFTATGCIVILQPGDTFSITFSSIPTINVIGQ